MITHIMKISLLKNSNLIFILIITFLLAFRNGSTLIFNGLPWIGKFETIFIIFFPFLLFLKINYVSIVLIRFFLIFLIILKIILFFGPSFGIGHKIFINLEGNDELASRSADSNLKNNFIKTYNSLWNKNFSKVQEHNWDNKDYFPLDWVNYDQNYNHINGNTAKSNPSFDKLNLNHKISFFIIKNDKFKINLNLTGIEKKSTFKIYKLDQSSNDYLLFDTYDYKRIQLPITLNDGYYKFDGDVNFNSKDWKFSPTIITNDKSRSLINSRICYVDNIKNFNSFILNLFIYLGYIFDFGILFLFFLFIFILLQRLYKNHELKIVFISLCFSLLYLAVIYIKDLLIWINFIGLIWPISLIFLSVVLLMLIDNSRNQLANKFIFKNDNIYRNYIIIFLPIIIFFILNKYGSNLQKTYFWTHGDDWTVFQAYARNIFIDGQWLLAGEKIFYFRPGARYLYGLIHYLFGESAFAQMAIETILVFFISIIVIYYLKTQNLANNISTVAGLTLLVFFFGENFRWLLGRGLSEYYLTFFIMMAFLFIKLNSSNYYYLFLACIFGIIAAWLREDKILTILSLIFISETFQKNINYYFSIFYFLKKNYKKVLFYFTIVLFGFPFLFEVRNYIIGGGFTISSHPNAFVFNYQSIYKFLFATPWDTTPRLTPLFLFVPVLLCLLTLFSQSLLKIINQPGITLVILFSLVPSFFLEMAAYVPRYSISLLPFGIIYMFIFFNNFYFHIVNNKKN